MFLRFTSTFLVFALAGCGGGGGNTSIPETPVPPSNNPPVFTSSSTFDVEENQVSIGTLVATDSDGDTLSYSVPEMIRQLSVSIHRQEHSPLLSLPTMNLFSPIQ